MIMKVTTYLTPKLLSVVMRYIIVGIKGEK